MQPSINRRQALALIGLSTLGATRKVDVDLALVLAIDCSFSVGAEEYNLQMRGLGSALMNPQVFEAIQHGPNKKIAITAFLFADDQRQNLIIPWRTLATAEDAFSMGMHLLNISRDLAPGGTSISSALLFAQVLLKKAPKALRQVVDLSTDGINNSGPPPIEVRDQLSVAGITINARAIVNEVKSLAAYLESEVTSGEGSFVLRANSYQVYGEAILKKLIKEIEGPGIS